MKRFAAVALSFCFGSPSALEAQDILASKSANDILPGCARYLAYFDGQGDFTDTLANSLQNGFCTGSVVGITETLLVTRFACQPKTGRTSYVPAVRIVVEYINNRRERMNEPFNMLAIEALTHAWPCLKPK